MSEISLRIFSSIILLFIMFLLITGDVVIFLTIVFIFNFFCLWEYIRLIKFYKLGKLCDNNISNFFLSRIKLDYKDIILISLFIATGLLFFHGLFLFFIIFFFLCLYLFFVFNSQKKRFLIGIIYIYIPFLILLFLKSHSQFKEIVLFVIIFSFFVDSSAYFIGKKIGGIKLATSISPNKTIAGFLGGLLVPTLICLIYYGNTYSFTNILIFSVLFSLTVQIGDLIQSKFKRACNVKDCSNIIPGHGGLLDRLDGIFLFLILISLLLILDYNLFFISI